jgi:catechol 2,3-dioxygenase-like lactoylglutathione lyase family enzyme
MARPVKDTSRLRLTNRSSAPGREQLRAHGVVIESEVEWSDGKHSLYFRDPAGNVVEFAPPTLWRTKDGRINP